MSPHADRAPGWIAGLGAGCDRLLHPSVVDPQERRAQARLVGVLLAGPVLAAAAVLQTFAPTFGLASALAVVCTLLAAGWLSAVTVIAGGRRDIAPAAAVASAFVASAVIAAGGGIASPLALFALAPLAETVWAGGSRRSLLAAALLVPAVVAGQAGIAHALPLTVSEPSALHWLAPLLYLATLVVRFHGGRSEPAVRTPDATAHAEKLALLVLNGQGDVDAALGPIERRLGLPPHLVDGRGLFDRIHVADRVAYLCAVADAAHGQERSVEIRLRRPPVEDRETFAWLALDLSPSRGAVLAVVRDGSEAAELRSALAAARGEAEAGDRAKDRFLAIVSHELRTPLNAIIGFSDMVLGGMAGPLGSGRQREYVGLIREAGHHLLGLVNAILDVSKLESGSYDLRPETFRFRDAVEACTSMLSLQAAAKDVTIETVIADSAGDLRADPRAVRQMLINLVANAVKFTREGGRVRIGARRIGTQLRFWVEDDGIGIEPADLARLGQPFQQVRNDYTRQFEGTGLGLALVRGLVALHGGGMSLESAPGEGTTVTITLPVAGPSEDAAGHGLPADPTTEEDIRGSIHGTLRKIA